MHRSFSHDVMVTILVYQNNETAAMLVSQENPVWIETFFLCKNLLLFQYICIAADHGSEDDRLYCTVLYWIGLDWIGLYCTVLY